MKKEKNNENVVKEENTTVVETTETENTKEKKKLFKKSQKEKKPHVKWKDLPKEVRKKKRRKYIVFSIIGLIVLFFVYSGIVAANAKLPVTTSAVKRETVETIISVSGKVESDEIRTYYSKIGTTIGTISVKQGQPVKKGDVLLKFDENSLAIAKNDAQAALLSSSGSTKDELNRNSKLAGDLTEANINLKVLEQQIIDQKAFIKEQEHKLEDTKNKRQASIYARQLEIAEGDTPGEHELAELEYLQNMLPINKDLIDIQRTIDDAKEILQNLEEYETEMKSQQNAADGNLLSKDTIEGKKTASEATVAKNQEAVDYAEKTENGLKADFDGVVTEITATEGAPVENGAALITVANNEKVHINVTLSKTDIEKIEMGQKADVTVAGHSYEGKVSAVSHVATLNNNNNPVISAEVEIINPDENIFLGVDAKAKIHAKKVENVLVVPVEAVNTDQTGDFVYIVENGIVVRKNVSTGISSDTYIEIKEGLKEGDQVITEVSSMLAEGIAVVANPSQDEETSTTQN